MIKYDEYFLSWELLPPNPHFLWDISSKRIPEILQKSAEMTISNTAISLGK